MTTTLNYDRTTDFLRATELLATMFSMLLREELTADELEQVNRQNEHDGYDASTCASHDFLDANETMYMACESGGARLDELVNRWDFTMEELWNAAWGYAKRNRFALEDPEYRRAINETNEMMADDE